MQAGRKPGCKKTGGKDFVKDDCRIHRGKRLSKEILAIRKFTQEEFIIRFEKYAFKKIEELNILADDRTISALDMLFCRALFNAAKKGEYYIVRDIVDRILGKPKETVDLGLNITGIKFEVKK